MYYLTCTKKGSTRFVSHAVRTSTGFDVTIVKTTNVFTMKRAEAVELGAWMAANGYTNVTMYLDDSNEA